MRSAPVPAASSQTFAVVTTDDDFDRQVRQATRPVVVAFCADWSVPSRALRRHLEGLARVYGGEVDFVRVDAEAAGELVRREAVSQVPTLRCYLRGRVVTTLVGAGPSLEVDRMVRRHARRGRAGGLIGRWWPRSPSTPGHRA